MISTANAQTPVLNDSHFHPVNPIAAEVGRLLFFDPILSGNQNIACATCHHPNLGTGDGLSLGLGEGAVGLGTRRRTQPEITPVLKRIPRNAPPLWNLGAREIAVLFHDGRLSKSDLWDNEFNSPAEENLPDGLNNILAAQALFPMTAAFEMAGKREENDVAKAARRRLQEAWPLIAQRVRTIPEYASLLRAAYPEITAPEQIEISHIVNALSDFMNQEFRSFDSPYDQYLGGDITALSNQQKTGMALFFGKAGCADCHSGRLLSDQGFHSIGLPNIGPGRTRQFDPAIRDVGRMGESDRLEDAYRFRTPMLRNVALTGPYGHNGTYKTLRGIVLHHLQPQESLSNWSEENAVLPIAPELSGTDFLAFQDAREMKRIKASISIQPRTLSDPEVAAIVEFLGALTGTESVTGLTAAPTSVPSGLPVDR